MDKEAYGFYAFAGEDYGNPFLKNLAPPLKANKHDASVIIIGGGVR